MTLAEQDGPAERRVPIGDSRNARHMGGYATADGRVTREDRLFRSGWFALADDSAREQLSALGITQIIDFRTSDELERKPLAIGVADGIEVGSLPILSGNMRAYIESTATLHAEEIDCKAAMISLYTDILGYAADAYRGMFATLARGEGGALLLCSAGKDRTGIGAALLLSALGVDRDDVISDYLLSADFYRGHEQDLARQHGYERTGHSMDRFHDVFTVYPDYIQAAHEAAEAKAGSMEALAA
jgi:protein-tyrosine phosphatase